MSDQEGPSPKKSKTTEENDDLDAERVSSPLRFYVKSILNNVEVWKLHFFSISKAVNFVYSAFKKCKISWKSKFRYFKCVKIAGFEPPDLLLWFHVKSEWYVENL